MSWSERYLQKKISTHRGAPTKPTKGRLDGESGAFVGFVGDRSLDRAGNFYADPDAPCPACGCGSFWRGKSWHCEQCAPPGDAHVRTWRNIGGGKVPSAPPPAEPWPADLDALLRRVAVGFEWSQQDVTDFRQWARRSPDGVADARQFLQSECAKLAPPGLTDRRRVVLDMLAADPALRVAWTCDDSAGNDPVRLVVAIRGAGCCEMGIPRAKFDALELPMLIEKLADAQEDTP